MITGEHPLIIFKFYPVQLTVLGLSMPMTIPIILNTDITGMAETSNSGSILWNNKDENGKLIQKGIGENLSIDFSCEKNSIFQQIVMPIFKQILASTSFKDSAFNLFNITDDWAAFNYQDTYFVDYFSGNTYLLNAVITSFSKKADKNTTLETLNIVLSTKPNVIKLEKKTELEIAAENLTSNNVPVTKANTVNTPLDVKPVELPTVVYDNSIIPYYSGNANVL
jgi:hypothetical protein